MKHVTAQVIREVLSSMATGESSGLPLYEWAIPFGVHLLQECDTCRQTVYRAYAEWSGLEPNDPRVEEEAFEHLYRRGVPPATLEYQARMDAAELMSMHASERPDRFAAEEVRFRSPLLVHVLLESCQASWVIDAKRALDCAEAAVDVAFRLDPLLHGNLAFHARSRAYAYLGNCLRLNEEIQASEGAFHRAHECYGQGSKNNPEVEAELQYLEASLATDQRRFRQAERMLRTALEFYRDLGKRKATAKTLIKQANLQYHRGRPEAGLPCLDEAAALLELDHESQLHWTVRYSQALYAVEAGDVAQARVFYRQHRELLESRAEPWFALRILWLRAKMARAEGDGVAARVLYAQVREGFMAEGMGYDAASASLELALLYLDVGDWASVQQLAAEMMPIFQAQDVHREALAALALFERAARNQELSLALASQLRRYLQLAQRDPSLTFRQFQRELGEQGKETS